MGKGSIVTRHKFGTYGRKGGKGNGKAGRGKTGSGKTGPAGKGTPKASSAMRKGSSGTPKANSALTTTSNGRLMKGHTILLVQYESHSNSRTYEEHSHLGDAIDSLCQMYEQVLKMRAGDRQDVAKYTLEELWQFVDGLHDVGCLIFDSQTGEFEPHNRAWIKRRIFEHLKDIAKTV